MNDYEYIEIRLYFIGAKGVGKKSILSKFNSIPSSKEVLHKTELPIPTPTYPESLIAQSQISPTSITAISPQKTTSLITMTKQYELMKCLLGIKGYIMPLAEQLNYPHFDHYDHENDKDYEIIKKHQMIFNRTKQRLETLITEDITDNTITYNTSIEHFFIFLFDLSDYRTFEAILLYYNSLNKHFELKDNYNKVIFGNKFEKKVLFNQEQQRTFEHFLKETKMYYYEISTRPFFAFSKFFQMFFFDHMSSIRTEFQSPIIRNRFKSILFAKSNFAKAKRDIFGNIKPSPGPSNYDSVFDYGNQESFNEALTSPKSRYKKKIFINKIGPIFNKAPLESFIPKPPKETEEQKIESRIYDKNKQYLANPLGYSLGIKPGILNLRQIQKDKKAAMNAQIMDSFQVNISNLIAKKTPSKPKAYDDDYFTDVNNNKEQYHQTLQRERSARNIEILRLHKENKIKIIQHQKSAISSKYEFTKIRHKNITHEENSRHLMQFAEKNILGKRAKIITPGPDYYDIRGSLFNKHKGFSLVGKQKSLSQSHIMSPPFADIQSEFDIIIKKNQNKIVSSYQDRFPIIQSKAKQNKLNVRMKELDEKLEQWNENRFDNEVSNKLRLFFEKRHQRKNEQVNHIIEIEKSKEEDDERRNKNRRKGDKDYRKYHCVKFDLVEERSPAYSIKGRHAEKKNEWNDLNDSESKTIDQNLDHLGNKLTQVIYPIAQENYIKPSLITYSFPKQKRFSKGNMQRAMSAIFLNGNYSQADHINFSNKEQFKIKEPRFNQFLQDKYPGPGDYPFKSFSDEIVVKGTKVNSIRSKIRTNAASIMENKLNLYMNNGNNTIKTNLAENSMNNGTIEHEQPGTNKQHTIEDILDDDEIVQQFRMNGDLEEQAIIKKLIDYATKMPKVDDYKEGYKFPLNACEILCSSNSKINQIIIKSIMGDDYYNNNLSKEEENKDKFEEENNDDFIMKSNKDACIFEDESNEEKELPVNHEESETKEEPKIDKDHKLKEKSNNKEEPNNEEEPSNKEEPNNEEEHDNTNESYNKEESNNTNESYNKEEFNKKEDKTKEQLNNKEEEINHKEEYDIQEDKENVLDYYFKFLYSNEDNENYVLVGYFYKIFQYFLDIKYDIVLKYLYEDHPEHLSACIKLLNKRSIGDFISKVLTFKDESQLQSINVIVNPDYNTQKLKLLTEIIAQISSTTSLDNEYFICTMEMLNNTLLIPEFHNFFTLSLDSSQCLLSIIYHLLNDNLSNQIRFNAIISFLIKYNESLMKSSFPNRVTPIFTYMMNPSSYYDEQGEIETQPENQTNIKMFFKVLLESKFNFLSDLGNYDLNNIMTATTYERPQKRLGLKKLLQVELYRSIIDIIINANFKEYYVEDINILVEMIINGNTFQHLIEIFFLYEMNNLYQTFFRQIISIILSNHCPVKLLTFLFGDNSENSNKSLNLLKKLIENIHNIQQTQFTYNSNNITTSCSFSNNIQLLYDILSSPNSNLSPIFVSISKDIVAFNEIVIEPIMIIFKQKLLLCESTKSFSQHFDPDPKEDDGLIFSQYSLVETNEQYLTIYDEYKKGNDYKQLLKEKTSKENLHKKHSSNLIDMNEDLNLNDSKNEDIFDKLEDRQRRHDYNDDMFNDDIGDNNLFDQSPTTNGIFQMRNSGEILLGDLNDDIEDKETENAEKYFDNNYWNNVDKKDEDNKIMEEFIMKDLGL